MTGDEDVNKRLIRFFTASFVVMISALAALGHAAASLRAKTAAVHAHVRHG